VSTDVTVDTRGFEELLLAFYNGVCDDAIEEMFNEWRTAPIEQVPYETGAMTQTMTFDRTDETPPVLERLIIAPQDYSSYQEEGTGEYIGAGRIYPTTAKVLVFYWKKTGRVMFLPSVAGTPPTYWFSRVRDRWPEFVERMAR
jgi:hypothetical protein